MKFSRLTPALIVVVYNHLSNYKATQDLSQMERELGIHKDLIQFALCELEKHGYLAISRARKPFQYRIIK